MGVMLLRLKPRALQNWLSGVMENRQRQKQIPAG
jgi:hypothetical protein